MKRVPTLLAALVAIALVALLIARCAVDSGPGPQNPEETTQEATHADVSEETTHSPGPLTIPDLPETGGPK